MDDDMHGSSGLVDDLGGSDEPDEDDEDDPYNERQSIDNEPDKDKEGWGMD